MVVKSYIYKFRNYNGIWVCFFVYFYICFVGSYGVWLSGIGCWMGCDNFVYCVDGDVRVGVVLLVGFVNLGEVE